MFTTFFPLKQMGAQILDKSERFPNFQQTKMFSNFDQTARKFPNLEHAYEFTNFKHA